MAAEILTTEQMYAADRFAMDGGIPGTVLMEAAGKACADEICRRHAPRPVSVLCGTGNNGGDGFVIARLLAGRGWPATVCLLGDRDRVAGDAAAMLDRWTGPVIDARTDDLPDARAGGLVVDALFGAGLTRPLDGRAADLAGLVNASGATVVAVDVPSGVDGTTGTAEGAVFDAELTVTFFRAKPGHLLLPGRSHCGELVVADIGIPDSACAHVKSSAWHNAREVWSAAFPVPDLQGHKYGRGHAVVLSGGPESTGAARLAARGALRAGAGLVTVASPGLAMSVNAAHLTAIMLRRADDADDLAGMLEDRRLNSVVAGPGLGVGEPTRQKVRTVLASGAHAVLDADALTSFDGAPEALFAKTARRRSATVLTPHDGEFARLFPDIARTAGDHLTSARHAARRSGATCVRKGPTTVIAAPDGRAALNTNAPPDLATAGSGDVLAGIVSGLLAQGMPGFEAACAAVWMHGEAGRLCGRGLIAEDLPEMLRTVLANMDSGGT